MNILLVHLISSGDLLYATAIARQIKEYDYPDCNLTWAVGSIYSSILINNPYVDRVWEIGIIDKADGAGRAWRKLKKEIESEEKRGVYDKVFFTQIGPDNWHNFDGMIRSSIFRNYPHKITVPIEPVICLTKNEIKNVQSFVLEKTIHKYNHVILFECAPQSYQSFINPKLASTISHNFAQQNPDACIILSSSKTIKTALPNVIDGSKLTVRENAELTKYCHLLIGCSSGITWITTSTWARPLPMIQLLNKEKFFASVQYDQTHWGKKINYILEISKYDENKILDCMTLIKNGNFKKAQKKYGEELKPFYSDNVKSHILNVKKRKGLKYFIRCYVLFTITNGFNCKIMRFYLRHLIKKDIDIYDKISIN